MSTQVLSQAIDPALCPGRYFRRLLRFSRLVWLLRVVLLPRSIIDSKLSLK